MVLSIKDVPVKTKKCVAKVWSYKLSCSSILFPFRMSCESKFLTILFFKVLILFWLKKLSFLKLGNNSSSQNKPKFSRENVNVDSFMKPLQLHLWHLRPKQSSCSVPTLCSCQQLVLKLLEPGKSCSNKRFTIGWNPFWMCILIFMKLHIFTRSFFLSQFRFLMNIPRKRRCIFVWLCVFLFKLDFKAWKPSKKQRMNDIVMKLYAIC